MCYDEMKPALQVIVLGSGGGPQESNTTAFLVRSVEQDWRRGSVIAVDAGVHLSSITRLIEAAMPSETPEPPFTLATGPFAGLPLPFTTASANAAHITRSLVDTYLITHPHLDHISGFVVNTAGLPGTRPKKVAALPSTIQALKTHIFNNVIWPNLSDENNGAGLLTYLRLVEGGSPALGEGEGRGYSEICDGLLIKVWSVSHGHCIERHSHRGSASSASTRFGSHDGSSQTPRRDVYNFPTQPPLRTSSLLSQAAFGPGSPQAEQEKICVYDSSAYFIQEQGNHREVLIFGDVEPDSVSLSPRNLQIWQEAAPKIAAGNLRAIFIECSYDDSQCNDRLFGHLKPVFVIEELRTLASEVEGARKLRAMKKRKRMGSLADEAPRRVPSNPSLAPEDPVSPKTIKSSMLGEGALIVGPDTPHLSTPTAELSLREAERFSPTIGPQRQLEGLKVIIIHVKDKLSDGPPVGETILQELLDHEKDAQLGCEFIVSKPGQSFYL
ncbi:cAMP phosphodiesterases class-II-domain-containing protein [Ilyonectria robusta]|uniref:cAMP phosphodiesterases class-II-domain-containing protein n=1 Tax=Ilyonectria robusta TaxID=1079257 RepID=UPI001E8CE4F9|nr:cAMP phosphodiesterases class-II-domain-containing protein [Ilyonectria robusta]KAH8738128.1 cAMP phosphodiesterases class-II-domain-containing protein [Ilyonectria robusta]